MSPRNLSKVRRDIERLRRKGGVKGRELEAIAKALGKERDPRGKEPTWVNKEWSEQRPLSIPSHPRDLNKYTAKAILDRLEQDLDEMEIADA